jgi:hypothetical protein
MYTVAERCDYYVTYKAVLLTWLAKTHRDVWTCYAQASTAVSWFRDADITDQVSDTGHTWATQVLYLQHNQLCICTESCTLNEYFYKVLEPYFIYHGSKVALASSKIDSSKIYCYENSENFHSCSFIWWLNGGKAHEPYENIGFNTSQNRA